MREKLCRIRHLSRHGWDLFGHLAATKTNGERRMANSVDCDQPDAFTNA